MSTDDYLEPLRTRLEAAMTFRGTTQRALAGKAGLGETVVRDILQGLTKDIRLSTIQKLAGALELDVVDLVPALLGPSAPDQPLLRSVHHGDGAVEVRQVDLAYSMGPGTEISDYPDEIPVKFDPGFLRAVTRAPTEKLFVARSSGDSMQPTLINDDQVLIDTTQRMLNLQDRIWALSVNGAGMIKRLRTLAGGRVRIISDNALVPPEEVDADDVFLVGRVVWFGRRL